MYATWVQNHPPNKSYSNSWILPVSLGRFLDFLGRNKNFVGQNLKNVPWNRTNNVLFHPNYTLFLLKKAQITRKRAQYLKRGLKISIFKPSENRIISQQLFLNSDLDVKWRNRYRENIPNWSLDSEQFLFDCWADSWLWVWRHSGLRWERTRNKMPTKKKSDIPQKNVALNMFPHVRIWVFMYSYLSM